MVATVVEAGSLPQAVSLCEPQPRFVLANYLRRLPHSSGARPIRRAPDTQLQSCVRLRADARCARTLAGARFAPTKVHAKVCRAAPRGGGKRKTKTMQRKVGKKFIIAQERARPSAPTRPTTDSRLLFIGGPLVRPSANRPGVNSLVTTAGSTAAVDQRGQKRSQGALKKGQRNSSLVCRE